jgi:hypothetical protein
MVSLATSSLSSYFIVRIGLHVHCLDNIYLPLTINWSMSQKQCHTLCKNISYFGQHVLIGATSPEYPATSSMVPVCAGAGIDSVLCFDCSTNTSVHFVTSSPSTWFIVTTARLLCSEHHRIPSRNKMEHAPKINSDS